MLVWTLNECISGAHSNGRDTFYKYAACFIILIARSWIMEEIYCIVRSCQDHPQMSNYYSFVLYNLRFVPHQRMSLEKYGLRFICCSRTGIIMLGIATIEVSLMRVKFANINFKCNKYTRALRIQLFSFICNEIQQTVYESRFVRVLIRCSIYWTRKKRTRSHSLCKLKRVSYKTV